MLDAYGDPGKTMKSEVRFEHRSETYWDTVNEGRSNGREIRVLQRDPYDTRILGFPVQLWVRKDKWTLMQSVTSFPYPDFFRVLLDMPFYLPSIPNRNWFSVFYGYRFGTGYIFFLPGAYRQYVTEENNKRCPNMWLEKPGNQIWLGIIPEYNQVVISQRRKNFRAFTFKVSLSWAK
jgi:hypothetical protein